MQELVKELIKFNRKERYWLLRNTLGNELKLCNEFKNKLNHITGISIPENAWWAMDYHIDWLFGALSHIQGEKADHPHNNKEGEISGTQEDIDFLIAFDKTLILIEAKADTSWSRAQLDSKINRIDKLVKFYTSNEIELKLILMSPAKELSDNFKRENNQEWPEWMINPENKKPLFLSMDMGHTSFLMVSRCDANSKPKKNGDCWIVRTTRHKLTSR